MISVFGSDIGDQEIEAAVECLRSQWLGFGKKVDDFEIRLDLLAWISLLLLTKTCYYSNFGTFLGCY